jgi:PAS domain S-box-containing protein
MLIILAMLAGNAVLLWQFRQARKQAERLAGVDQQLITVLQAHAALMSFYERLDALAQSKDSVLLLKQLETIHNALLRDMQRTREVFSHLPVDVQVDPTLLPTLLAIQGELPAQLEAAAVLAKAGDWDAVRLRLTNQIRPLESRSFALVENIDREVDEAQAQAVLNIQQAQRRIVLIVLLTAALTLLFAAFLGLVITRSITRPLGRLVEGSAALASGDFSHRVPTIGNDEITRVGSVFNDMIMKLRGLYRELQSREMYLAEAEQLSHTGSFGWDSSSGKIYWSVETFRIFEFELGAEVTVDAILERTHPEDRATLQQFFARVARARTTFDVEHRLLMRDGSVKYLRVVGRPATDYGEGCEFVGAVQDVTQHRMSEEALATARSELAKVARATSLGVLTASIAHEVNQPLSGIITNAGTCLRMLSADPPNIDGARETARRTIRDGNRASDVITRLRTLYSKKDPSPDLMDLNEAAREVMALSLSDLKRNRVILRHELADDLPTITADRIQLEQVILNLLRNASEAMSTVDDRPRELLIRTERDEENKVRLSVKDTGVGFTPHVAEKLFEAFYTTKTDGMGIGLSISRSIIEAHHGRLWARPNDGHGATFSFAIPCSPRGLAACQAGVDRT